MMTIIWSAYQIDKFVGLTKRVQNFVTKLLWQFGINLYYTTNVINITNHL